MVQNHILQPLAMVAMEPPHSLDADVIRDERLEVLKSLRPIDSEKVDADVVRAQYGPGFILGKAVAGYAQESGVAAASATETYVALRACIDNWRWAGVPFFLRTGKRLPKRASEISIHLKEVTPILDRWSERGRDGLATYPAGDWGPQDGEALIDSTGRRWLAP